MLPLKGGGERPEKRPPGEKARSLRGSDAPGKTDPGGLEHGEAAVDCSSGAIELRRMRREWEHWLSRELY
jgi:hypothetical protein